MSIKVRQLKYLLLILSAVSSSSMAARNADFINEIPDFTQSNIKGWRYANGAEMCAPVAVSNSLVWMTGMDGDQANLIKLLASSRYMNTDAWKGTKTTDILLGVHTIAMDFNGGYTSLEYQGWKKHPRQFSTGIEVPDIHWMIDGIGAGSAVWLNVGWYRYDWRHDKYYRVGGHWVTLVGYDDSVLIIHDPAPRAGHLFANEYVQTSIIQHGALVNRKDSLYRSAKGYLLLGEGMHIKSTADVAIVDGAIRFAL